MYRGLPHGLMDIIFQYHGVIYCMTQSQHHGATASLFCKASVVVFLDLGYTSEAIYLFFLLLNRMIIKEGVLKVIKSARLRAILPINIMLPDIMRPSFYYAQ